MLAPAHSRAEDWPTYGGDPSRSQSTAEALPVPLQPDWVLTPAQPPRPAIRNGHAEPQLIEPVVYDYVFHPVVAGGSLFYGSSSEETLVCVDAATGKEKWVFFANGPVRIPPTVVGDSLFFGSDDGFVYCLKAADGTLVWKQRVAQGGLKSAVLGRPVSAWPVNSGPLVDEGTVYAAAGFFPPQGVNLQAMDAATGTAKWQRQILYAPRGQIARNGEWLWLPTGRTAPAEFKVGDGSPRVQEPALRRAFGGSFVGRPAGGIMAWGPNEWGMMNVRFSEEAMEASRAYAAGVASGTMTMLECRAIAGDDKNLYFVKAKEIWAVPKAEWIKHAEASVGGGKSGMRRAKGKAARFTPQGITAGGQDMIEDEALLESLTNGLDGAPSPIAWKVPNDFGGVAVLRAGNQLLVGGKDAVVALDASTGRELWRAKVDGEARGLAVAGGSLFVGTTTGAIHRFSKAGSGSQVAPAKVPLPPAGAAASALAGEALAAADTDQGFCFVLGAGDTGLLAEIATHSRFLVIALEKDAAVASRARQELRKAGLYGDRILVREEPGADLEYALGLGNLVVALGGGLVWSAPSVLKLVQPYGGVLVLAGAGAGPSLAGVPGGGFSKWEKAGTNRIARRGALPGAGEWSHVYADPGATSSSGDELVSTDMVLQWAGPPGPKDSPDRHNVAQTPLWKDGKFYYPTLDQSIIAIDSYNGTNLWRFRAPLSVRQMISHNAGGVCAGDGKLFVASGDGLDAVDTKTGDVAHRYPLPGAAPDRVWGYAAVVGDLLIGSTQSKKAAEAATEPQESKLNSFFVLAGDQRSNPVFTDHLFAINHASRNQAWEYKGPLVMHTTLAASENTLFFAETKNEKAARKGDGTLDLAEFFADASLVALDLASGREKWRTKLEPLTGEPNMMMYLGFKDGVLVSYRSYYLEGILTYEIKGIDAATGKDRWTQHVKNSKAEIVKPLRFGKNAFSAHPVIMGGKVYVLPFFLKATLFAYDLQTGEQDAKTSFSSNWQNKGCTPPSGASNLLFYRNTSVYAFNVDTRKDYDVTRVTRPACWLSVVPAGGIIVTPEMGAFCTCGNAYQISSGLAPAEFPVR